MLDANKILHFMADECCDFAVVRALRAEGYDVFAVGEVMQHSVDRSLLELAIASDRILLTEDKDFGWLVYAGTARSAVNLLIDNFITAYSAGQSSQWTHRPGALLAHLHPARSGRIHHRRLPHQPGRARCDSVDGLSVAKNLLGKG